MGTNVRRILLIIFFAIALVVLLGVGFHALFRWRAISGMGFLLPPGSRAKSIQHKSNQNSLWLTYQISTTAHSTSLAEFYHRALPKRGWMETGASNLSTRKWVSYYDVTLKNPSLVSQWVELWISSDRSRLLLLVLLEYGPVSASNSDLIEQTVSISIFPTAKSPWKLHSSAQR